MKIKSSSERDTILSIPETIQAKRYWDGKFVALNLILLFLAAIAAYLEYVAYTAIMTQTYGETGLSLQLSFLTFRWNAVSCLHGSCGQVPGVQALDFFQIFVIALILVNISHYLGRRKSSESVS